MCVGGWLHGGSAFTPCFVLEIIHDGQFKHPKGPRCSSASSNLCRPSIRSEESLCVCKDQQPVEAPSLQLYTHSSAALQLKHAALYSTCWPLQGCASSRNCSSMFDKSFDFRLNRSIPTHTILLKLGKIINNNRVNNKDICLIYVVHPDLMFVLM